MQRRMAAQCFEKPQALAEASDQQPSQESQPRAESAWHKLRNLAADPTATMANICAKLATW